MSNSRPEDDELHGPESELIELYRRLRPPELADHVDEADPETARVVHWLRGAWREIEVPPARVPLAPRRAPRFARRILVAAAALLVLGVALWRVRASRMVPASAPPLVQTPAPSAGVEVIAALPDRLELRSGPVRLVLLEPPPTVPVHGTHDETRDSSAGG